MHGHLQLGVRENPASDRRHGSRFGIDTKSSSHCIDEENTESRNAAAPATPVLVGVYSSAHAAPSQPATEREDSAAATTEQPLAVERPLTCEEAAAFVRAHPKTVKRMARTGELPGHFRFGRWFFYASELDSWMRTELHSSRHSCRQD